MYDYKPSDRIPWAIFEEMQEKANAYDKLPPKKEEKEEKGKGKEK